MEKAIEVAGHRVPASPRQPATARPACRRRPSPPPTCNEPCCGWCTACCSGRSPKTAACCSTPTPTPAPIDRYTRYFSSARLRRLARTRIGTRHGDLWDQTRAGIQRTGTARRSTATGTARTGWTVRNHRTRHPRSRRTFQRCAAPSHAAALHHPDANSHSLRSVDFAHLGAEELGSIYEGLLELHPAIDPVERTFTLGAGAGNERKTTGSYYTPRSLVDLVLDTALDPVLDRVTATGTPEYKEQALLDLRVCDPACGSGHFLVAAARRIAHRLAQVRNAESEPTPTQAQAALHDVVRLCIYGVDLNPMAAELAKVSLWLEAIQPGRPLGFLDAHIRVGNSLLGTTPALIAKGVPDAAFTAITGDDKKVAAAWKRANRAQRNAKEAGAQTDPRPRSFATRQRIRRTADARPRLASPAVFGRHCTAASPLRPDAAQPRTRTGESCRRCLDCRVLPTQDRRHGGDHHRDRRAARSRT